MAQKFELDPKKPSEEQIRKTEYMINKNSVFIHYHYKEGQIFRKPTKIDRNDLLNQGKMGEKGDVMDNEQSKQLQFFAKIKDYEQKCFTSIKANEDKAYTERG